MLNKERSLGPDMEDVVVMEDDMESEDELNQSSIAAAVSENDEPVLKHSPDCFTLSDRMKQIADAMPPNNSAPSRHLRAPHEDIEMSN